MYSISCSYTCTADAPTRHTAEDLRDECSIGCSYTCTADASTPVKPKIFADAPLRHRRGAKEAGTRPPPSGTADVRERRAYQRDGAASHRKRRACRVEYLRTPRRGGCGAQLADGRRQMMQEEAGVIE